MRAGPKNSKWGTEAARWVAPASKELALDLATSPLAELSGEEEPRAWSPVLRQLTKHLTAIKMQVLVQHVWAGLAHRLPGAAGLQTTL